MKLTKLKESVVREGLYMKKEIPKKIEEELKKMKGKILEIGRQPVFFIGSGLSRRYLGSPNWDDLLTMIARKAGYEYSDFKKEYGEDNERIAQELEYYYFRSCSTKEVKVKDRKLVLREEIANIVGKNEIQTDKENEIQELKKTRPQAIITTNYDNLLEQLFENEYTRFIGQRALINNKISETGEIYKIHGCISEPDTIIITKEDYDDFFDKSKYLYAKILTMFWEYPLIFMGYSISDRNIKDILTSIVEMMNETELENFLERVWILGYTEDEEGVEKSKIELLNNKSINITYFKLKDYKRFYKSINSATLNQKFGQLEFSISENVIELLIEPLYEQQEKVKVVTRELLQNSLDACKEKQIESNIRINLIRENNNYFLEIMDNGIGMDLAEIKNSFLTIGKSNKKDSEEGLVGRYGIGILSIFLLGEYAEIITKKSDTDMIAFKIYTEKNTKQVSWLDDSESKKLAKGIDCNSYTRIKIKISDTIWVEKIETVENFIKELGLEKYITNSSNTIVINYLGEQQELLKIEDKHKIWFHEENKEISIYKKKWMNIDEDSKNSIDISLEKIFKQDNTIFYNDMISKVEYDKKGFKQLEGFEIPFIIAKFKNLKEKEKVFKTELSRSLVTITGDLMNTVAEIVYSLEIDQALKILEQRMEEFEKGMCQIFELKNELQRECWIFGNNCDILIKGDKLLLTSAESIPSVVNICGSEYIAEKIIKDIKKEIVLYGHYIMTKTLIADYIENDKIICISKTYLDEYIYRATGPNNGLRMKAMKKVLNILGRNYVSDLESASQLWSYVTENKKSIREDYEEKSKDGIFWFKEDYKDESSTNRNNLFGQGFEFIAFESWHIENYIDNKFQHVLKMKLEENPNIGKVMQVHSNTP